MEQYEIDRTALVVKRNRYWASLKDMRSDFMKENGSYFNPSDKKFYSWVADKYGIQVLEEGGMILGRYNIVDDSKYLVYWLKYGK
jgi:hypothetical protein